MSDLRESEIIHQWMKPLTGNHAGALGLRDDASMIEPSGDLVQVISTDMLVEGIHFLKHGTPEDIAYRALMTNLSDIAAMGAIPHSYQLALGLTRHQGASWMASFAQGLQQAQQAYNLFLSGGDTVRGCPAITISITIMGYAQHPIKRSAASVGDHIYVTGTLGDAALGLHCLQGNLALENRLETEVVQRYWHPDARVGVGQLLQGHATSMMDISDGLITDVQKLCAASQCGASIHEADLPLSAAGQYAKTHLPELWQHCVSAGDDYELLFTLPNNERTIQKVRDILNQQGSHVPITQIGTITASADVVLLDPKGAPHYLPNSGYQH